MAVSCRGITSIICDFVYFIYSWDSELGPLAGAIPGLASLFGEKDTEREARHHSARAAASPDLPPPVELDLGREGVPSTLGAHPLLTQSQRL